MNSVTLRPFFSQWGCHDGNDAKAQRLVINRVLIDGAVVLDANPLYYNAFSQGSPSAAPRP